MKQVIIQALKVLGLYGEKKIPAGITSKFRTLTVADQDVLREAVIKTYQKDVNQQLPETIQDLEDHLTARLHKFRSRHIPFLEATTGLKDKSILEIGCGTGSSSIALAEQGANVFGIDVDQPSLDVAAVRAGLYGLKDKISLQYGNATELSSLFAENKFDIVIFFASIEHMTHDERIKSLQGAWKVIKTGGALCILGSPNRLWYFDMHTSSLPFNMWLPDDLAYKYSAFSPRPAYNQLYKEDFKSNELEFFRWGRGISFHELDIAIKPVTELKVLGDLHAFERPKNFLQKMLYRRTDEYKFKRILANIGPKGMAPGFYEYYIDVIVQK
jgi:S-adenosylmethionine-dependent methyltransferase